MVLLKCKSVQNKRLSENPGFIPVQCVCLTYHSQQVMNDFKNETTK